MGRHIERSLNKLMHEPIKNGRCPKTGFGHSCFGHIYCRSCQAAGSGAIPRLLELLQPGFEVIDDTNKSLDSLVFSLRFGYALDDRTLHVATRQ